MLIFYGTGRNGKSTFLDHIMKVFGEYGINSPKSLVIANPRGDDPGAASPALADLGRRRFSCISETEANAKLAESKVKDLISGETVRARQLHAGFQDLRVITKLVLSSNHIPNIAGTDTGIWRRVLLVDFKEDFTGREDLALGTILENEREGILNWALEGCRRYQEEGLTVPDCIKSATVAFRESQDILGQFIQECCVEHPDNRAPQKETYEAYKKWAHEWGLTISSGKAFNKKLKERGFATHPLDGYPRWHGFSLRDEVTSSESH
jgi:putative DNA primase/helicase